MIQNIDVYQNNLNQLLFYFSKTPANIKRAPKLGEHNSELLNKLGYSEKDIQNLIEDKII